MINTIEIKHRRDVEKVHVCQVCCSFNRMVLHLTEEKTSRSDGSKGVSSQMSGVKTV